MKCLFFVASGMFLLAGCLVEESQEKVSRSPAEKLVPSLIENCESWAKAHQEPAVMDPATAGYCKHLTPGETIDISGPHAMKWIQVYVNETGEKAMKERKTFPEGSIIAKKKLAEQDSQEAELYTVMRKSKKGTNPKMGDWEFMVFDKNKALQTPLEDKKCMSCHTKVKDLDYVFGNYLNR